LVTKIILQSRLGRAIGHGRSSLSIISSAALASTIFFYIFSLGSIFRIPIFIIEDRLTNNTYFTDVYVISRDVDHIAIAVATLLWLTLSLKGKARIIASAIYGLLCVSTFSAGNETLADFTILISIPIILSFLTYNKISNNLILNVYTGLTVNYFAIICTALGILSIVLSLLLIYFSQTIAIPVRNYAFMIYLLASSASTIMMFLLVFCVPLKLLIREGEKALSKFRKGVVGSVTTTTPINLSLRTKTKIFYLFLVVSLSVALAIIPHQPSLNKDNHYIGADTSDYISQLSGSKNSTNIEHFLQRPFTKNIQGDRPLSLVFLYTISKLLPLDVGHAIDYVPIVLGPSLAIVIYFLMREITSNEITPILASFLTAVSFQTLIGIYAGFYANWFALVIGYLSFVFLFRYLKKAGNHNLVLYWVLLVLLLFAHVYTWSVLTLVAGIFLVIMLKLNIYTKKRVILLLLISLSTVAIDFARSPSITSHTGIASDIRVANVYGIGVQQFFGRWDNLDDSVHGFFGAMFGNFMILVLGLYWLLRSDFRQPSTVLLMIFLSMAVIPVSVGDWVVQTRILYEIPFQIPTAIALSYILTRPIGISILMPVCIWLIAISFINVSNF
jgi:hypothetical protein